MELLDAAEVRVLGSLIEKEATTPEYYPLSLNALVNACNQKSNRDPVVNFDEETVEDALLRLRGKKLAVTITGGGRVDKYAQRISETLNLGRRELAALCTLLLRGPQTLGEVKDRSERMFAFTDLQETESVLNRLAELGPEPLVKKLPRQPGQKEARYAHLLAGEPASDGAGSLMVAPPLTRVGQLEEELQQLRLEVTQLRERLDKLESDLR